MSASQPSRFAPSPSQSRPRPEFVFEPLLDSDEAAEAFLANSDLTEYDLSGTKIVRFEFQPKTERVNMRLPRPLLDAVKEEEGQHIEIFDHLEKVMDRFEDVANRISGIVIEQRTPRLEVVPVSFETY